MHYSCYLFIWQAHTGHTHSWTLLHLCIQCSLFVPHNFMPLASVCFWEKRFSEWVHWLTSLFSNRGLCVKLDLLSDLPRNALAWVIRKESVCEWVTEYNKAEWVFKLLCVFFLIDALGFVKSIMGRRRSLPHIHSADWSLRNQAERQAVNFVLQGIVCVCTCVFVMVATFMIVTVAVCVPLGSAADLAKMAMIRVCSQVASASYTARYSYPFIHLTFHSLPLL